MPHALARLTLLAACMAPLGAQAATLTPKQARAEVRKVVAERTSQNAKYVRQVDLYRWGKKNLRTFVAETPLGRVMGRVRIDGSLAPSTPRAEVEWIGHEPIHLSKGAKLWK